MHGKDLPPDFVRPIGTPTITANLLRAKGRKFHAKGEEGILVGFNPALLSYRILTPAGSIINSKHVQFLKKSAPSMENSNWDNNFEELVFEDKNSASEGSLERSEPSRLESLDCEENDPNDTTINEENQSNNSDKEIQNNLVDQSSLNPPESQPTRRLRDRSTIRPPDRYGFHHYYEPRTIDDPCMYACEDGISFIFFHVDDLVLVGHGNDFKNKFADRFSNSACHPPNTLLGMKFEKVGNKICLSQPKHINHGLEELGLTECKPSSTPLTPNLKLREATDEDHEKFKKLNINYRSAIGLLNYIASNTRLDLSFAVSSLARYSVKPGWSHWKEVKKTWQYLRHTRNLKFTIYPVDPNEFLTIFSDATWGDDPDSRTSQSGYLCYLFGSLISWNSCRQRSITYSSTEAKLNPLVESFHEGLWLKALINEMWNLQI
ncbi:hypothetical protein VP01_3372g1 [Puccinia sorghi]|uniref:Retroviral polymerase SH3-like domain-containing protein n=1 Tax=Puccinia sorghi TaxID=27349 RepID=A0A0L6UWT4_9BASI|nr:hypothetical protein VP01_3372g1 [Puccinia sorghi]